MTTEINQEALKTAMRRQSEERLDKEIRDLFMYSASPETQRLYELYKEEYDKMEKSTSDSRRVMQWVAMLYGIAIIIYGIYHLFTYSPT